MTCKDCVYKKKCANREEMVQLDEHIWDEMEDIPCVEYFCKDFKNKADYVEVVRCKDCKYHHWEQEPEHGKTVHICSVIKAEVFKDFYCYHGTPTERFAVTEKGAIQSDVS